MGGGIDGELEKSHVFYMIIAMRLLYTPRWHVLALPKMEEWLMKMVELVKLIKFAKKTSLTISMFIADWKSLRDF